MSEIKYFINRREPGSQDLADRLRNAGIEFTSLPTSGPLTLRIDGCPSYGPIAVAYAVNKLIEIKERENKSVQLTNGNMFDIDADILINTVNCVGVMGCGVALAFKNKYPKMFVEYRNCCNRHEIVPGVLWVYQADDQKTIINFPTKNHWKNSSEYSYIKYGLIELREFLVGCAEGSIVAIPALGCGHGGLDWTLVLSMIQKELANIDHIIIKIFPPHD